MPRDHLAAAAEMRSVPASCPSIRATGSCSSTRAIPTSPAATGRNCPAAESTPLNEKAGLLGHHGWHLPGLVAFRGRLVPPSLPDLLAAVLAGQLTEPRTLGT
jgi:hypothetical protein